jgi:CO/xanthine dehydrogenase Mo-binding subunit
MVGGGFGGKSANQQAVEAARLSKAARRPVQVAWSRAEEFFYDRFRPAAVVTIRAGLDAAGRLALWDYHVYAAGQRGALHFYDIPHHRTSVHGSGWRGAAVSPHPLHTGAWRAPANNTNTFAREAHIDALAAKAGQDPVAFRLAHLTGDARVKRVLEAAAAKFGWTPRGPRAPAGSGGPGRGADGWRGHGVACGVDAGTVVAAMAEVAVDPATGHVQVLRVVVAQEMGTVINPAGAILQVEGCVTMGLGYALTEEVRFKGGRVLDDNFDTYAIPRLSWTPTIETVLLEVPATAAPQGGGEPAIVIVGALIANAIADATGARLLHLPMTPARVLAGLGRGK